MRAHPEQIKNIHLQNRIFKKSSGEDPYLRVPIILRTSQPERIRKACQPGLRGIVRIFLPEVSALPLGQGEQGPPSPPSHLPMSTGRTQEALVATLLNKPIATQHQADFFC